MLLDARDDREFQKYLDKLEQQLHVKMWPILAAGVRMQVQSGDTRARAYVKSRGKPVLLAHYKKIYRDMFNAVVNKKKPDVTKAAPPATLTDFMDDQLDYIESYSGQMIQNISSSLADYISDWIFKGMQEGLSNQEIGRQIRDDANDIGKTRSATIARTETHNAAMFAMDESITAGQIEVKTKTWLSANDSRVRPSHAAMHEVTVNYDQPFNTDDGDMMFPGDDSLGADPSGFINCRCVILYNTESQDVEEY